MFVTWVRSLKPLSGEPPEEANAGQISPRHRRIVARVLGSWRTLWGEAILTVYTDTGVIADVPRDWCHVCTPTDPLIRGGGREVSVERPARRVT